MGSENKIDVVLTRTRDSQMFLIDGHELIRANGEDLVTDVINSRSSETNIERERKQQVLGLLKAFVGEANIEDNRPRSTFRATYWKVISAYFAEYAKRDPSIVNNLSQLIDETPPALLALETQQEQVELCFVDFDNCRAYDERQCKRSLEFCARKIANICDARHRLPRRVKFSATSTIIYMLHEICSRTNDDRNLYSDILTDEPEDFWTHIFSTLRAVHPLEVDQKESLEMIYHQVYTGRPFFKQTLLDDFHDVIQ
jgi:hypothetical protein